MAAEGPKRIQHLRDRNPDENSNQESVGESVFSDVKIGGNARVHFGNIVVNQHLPSTPAHDLVTQVLKSLHFPEIFSRYSCIEENSSGTCDWILTNERDGVSQSVPWDLFTDWLGDDRQLYWISGKPGSGKSTLMKYLFTNLSDPESSPKSIAVSFWFWEAGVPLERSPEGCLRSLLWQILDNGIGPAHLIDSIISPLTRYNGRSDLRKALMKLVLALQHEGITVKIFLDGVDECGPDAESMLDIINELTDAVSSLKICLSSRPEQLFVDTLDECPKLRLQDLNKDDITRFFNDDFFSKPRVAKIYRNRQDEKQAHLFTLEENAQGVFLWARLVIKVMLRGLTNRDTVEAMYKRIESLPDDLDKFYAMMLMRNKQDNEYYKETAAFYFKLIFHRTMTMVNFCLAINPEKRKELLTPAAWTTDNLKQAIIEEDATAWVKVRSGGLLECYEDVYPSSIQYDGDLQFLNDPSRLKIGFIHRTARTYLLTNTAGLDLLSNCKLTDSDFTQICFETFLIHTFVLPCINGRVTGLASPTTGFRFCETCHTPSRETFEHARAIWKELSLQNRVLVDHAWPFHTRGYQYRERFPSKDDSPFNVARICCRMGWYTFAQRELQDSVHEVSKADAAVLMYEAIDYAPWLAGSMRRIRDFGKLPYWLAKQEQFFHLLRYLRKFEVDCSIPWVLPTGEHTTLVARIIKVYVATSLYSTSEEFHDIVKQMAGTVEHSIVTMIDEAAHVELLSTDEEYDLQSHEKMFWGSFGITDVGELLNYSRFKYVNCPQQSRIYVIADPTGSLSSPRYYGISQCDSDELLTHLKRPECEYVRLGFSTHLIHRSLDGSFREEYRSALKDTNILIKNVCGRSKRLHSITEVLLYMGKTQEQIDHFVSIEKARLEELNAEEELVRLMAVFAKDGGEYITVSDVEGEHDK